MAGLLGFLRELLRSTPKARDASRPDPELEDALARDPCNVDLRLAAAHACARAGRRAEAIAHCRAALDIRPALPGASVLLALLLKQAGNEDDAIHALRAARAAAPGDAQIQAHLHQLLGSGRVPMWHFSMMNDVARNRIYEEAISAVVNPGDRVLEIGAGSGLLAMMAARAGASHVTSCEMVLPIADKAREIVAQNGFSGKVSIIGKPSSALRIPQDMSVPADVLVAEIVSSDLLGEGMLDSYDDARTRLLKPGAVVIPRRAGVVAQLAGSDDLAYFARVDKVAGFDLAGFNDFTPAQLYPAELDLRVVTYSRPFEVFDFDLQSPVPVEAENKAIVVDVTADGVCCGVLQWIRLELAPGVLYENKPDAEQTREALRGHWRRMLHTFARPVEVRRGEQFRLVAVHDRNSLMFHASSAI